MVETYKLQNGFWKFIVFLKEYTYSLSYLLLSATKCENNKKTISVQNAVYSAQVNEQAGRLMTAYGNSVLRIAYSYLHNMIAAIESLQ